eukprot:scaffold3463_cov266-Ochromonas_danica.AAC.2
MRDSSRMMGWDEMSRSPFIVSVVCVVCVEWWLLLPHQQSKQIGGSSRLPCLYNLRKRVGQEESSRLPWGRAVWVGVGRCGAVWGGVGRCGVGLRGVTVVDRSVLGGPVWKTNPVSHILPVVLNTSEGVLT